MKKIALLLTTMLLPMVASAAVNVDGIYFNLDVENGVAEVAQNLEVENNIVIPEIITYEGREYAVTSIATSAFQDNSTLTSVVVPNSVMEIGMYAFQNCSGLTSIILPNNLTSINNYTFYGCSRLNSITIPDGVTIIGKSAFLGCTSLTSFDIPSRVTFIDQNAFMECEKLKSVSIPNSVTYIGASAFMYCRNLTDITIPNSLTTIERNSFSFCSSLNSIIIPNSVTTIGVSAFAECHGLASLTIGSEVKIISGGAFSGCPKLSEVFCYAEEVPNATLDAFGVTKSLYVPAVAVADYMSISPWSGFEEIAPLEEYVPYRPMIEDGKVWKVGHLGSGNPVQLIDYYYFDGDTIIDGKTCKQMMCQRYDNSDSESHGADPSPSYVGAWYEEYKIVRAYDTANNKFVTKYHFSASVNSAIAFSGNYAYMVGPKQKGGISGFKGLYREITRSRRGESYYDTTWLEGVGGIDGPTVNFYGSEESRATFLMSCTVGDEVIYLNDEYEDGATPEAAGARNRFDFTHTIKTKPKAPRRSEDERSVYGEYDKLQLGINLNLLADDYVVRITDDSGNVIYEKAVNASTIVGLNIDISGYAKGHYTVTVENSQESFTGEFDTLPTGIEETTKTSEVTSPHIYNLQGQRISTLQKGLNIVNGQKVYVK